MSSAQPISILIGALGGEGGGVLADWLTRAAEASGFLAQRTSIPGVAQRTGATTYYLEIVPGADTGERFVLALSPVPGQIDLMVSSELLEATRAAQSGLVNPERTVVIASSHRTLTVAEKSAMGDGRFDDERLKEAIRRFSRRAILFDMDAAARTTGAAVSAVMFGAIAGAGILPIARGAFERAIRDSGKEIDASLLGFAAGFAAAESSSPAASTSVTAAVPAQSAGAGGVADEFNEFPQALRTLVAHGYSRQRDYQNRKYADRYLERVRRIYSAERGSAAASNHPVSEAVARFLALWMAYEDIIRVGDLKSRHARLQRIREEVGAKPDEPVRVVEYLKPGIDEWCAILPAGVSKPLRRWAERSGEPWSFRLRLRTTSIHGFLLLRLLGALRWWRPYSARFGEEQALIERWLSEIVSALPADVPLALEIAQCGRLIKGYGATHARGKANFIAILDALAGPAPTSAKSRADVVREARAAALADPEGQNLASLPASSGFALSRPAPQPMPVSWHKSRTATRGR
ncbi:MAG TPA: indolepyruvate oxidoreductase subunit beta family protein [Burkholderiales bacterium]